MDARNDDARHILVNYTKKKIVLKSMTYRYLNLEIVFIKLNIFYYNFKISSWHYFKCLN